MMKWHSSRLLPADRQAVIGLAALILPP